MWPCTTASWPSPFRRYQIGKVYRASGRGRFREFYQADIDIIGDGSLSILNEAEIPAVIYKIFRGFGLNRFCIRVNNRKLLNGFYAMLGLEEKSGDIMRTVDKLEKIGAEKVREILVDDLAPDRRASPGHSPLHGYHRLQCSGSVRSGGLRAAMRPFDTGLFRAVRRHRQPGRLRRAGEPLCRDLTIARGLDYYTGTVYETTPAGLSPDRLRLLRRPVRQSGRILHRQEAARRGYFHWPDPGFFYVLDEQGASATMPGDASVQALVLPMTADPAPAIALAGGPRTGGLRTALRGKQEIQAENELCRQAGRALCWCCWARMRSTPGNAREGYAPGEQQSHPEGSRGLLTERLNRDAGTVIQRNDHGRKIHCRLGGCPEEGLGPWGSGSGPWTLPTPCGPPTGVSPATGPATAFDILADKGHLELTLEALSHRCPLHGPVLRRGSQRRPGPAAPGRVA